MTEAATMLATAAAEAAAAAAADGLDGADAAAAAATAAAAAFGSVAPPWQAPLVAALTVGVLSIDCVESIRRALGDIDPAITAEQLTGACEDLIASAGGLTPEQLFRRARQVRDGLDEGGMGWMRAGSCGGRSTAAPCARCGPGGTHPACIAGVGGCRRRRG